MMFGNSLANNEADIVGRCQQFAARCAEAGVTVGFILPFLRADVDEAFRPVLKAELVDAGLKVFDPVDENAILQGQPSYFKDDNIHLRRGLCF